MKSIFPDFLVRWRSIEPPGVFKKYVLFNWWQLFLRKLPKYIKVFFPLFNVFFFLSWFKLSLKYIWNTYEGPLKFFDIEIFRYYYFQHMQEIVRQYPLILVLITKT